MDRIVCVNGMMLLASEARVSIFDRGFLFGDGIYEVSAVLDGRLIDNAAHLDRMERSLAAIALVSPASRADIIGYQHELIVRNALQEGLVYLQITRGAAEREFTFPTEAKPTLVMFTQARAIIDSPAACDGIKVCTMPDLRWARRDIKSIGLLAQAMAKEEARGRGCAEAMLVEDGFVTEGAASTFGLVSADGTLVLRPNGRAILPGCTRAAIAQLAERDGIAVVERPFTPAEAMAAAELFITSATTLVTPVIALDGHLVGTGKPGPVAQALRAFYIAAARAEHLATE